MNYARLAYVSKLPEGFIAGLRGDLNDARDICHELAQAAGWWDKEDEYRDDPKAFMWAVAAKMALVQSEVSEALEGLRKSKMDDHLPHRKALEVELADAVIRIMDLSGKLGLDLGGAIMDKLEYNLSRPDHKREAREAEGGKAF